MAEPVIFSLDPALAAMAESATGDTGRVKRLAAQVGVHTRTILKWQERGGVDLWTADRIATKIGVNAVKLWPNWEDEADRAANEVPEQLDFLDLADAG